MKIVTSVLLGLAPLGALAAPLSVTVEGVEARGGTLYVSVQTEAEFMQERGTAGEMTQDPGAGTHEFTFDVPEGDYAVIVWHDDDADGEFTMSPQGQPLDGWGMSGPAPRGMPSFGDAAVTVGPDGGTARLSVTYPRAR